MKQNTFSFFKIRFWSLGVIICFAACRKDITSALPGGKQDIALNYYSASDVLLSAYGTANPAAVTAIYVDSIPKHPAAISGASFFYTNFTSVEYPSAPNSGIMNFVHYNFRPAGHRLIFTDTTGSALLDTTVSTPAKSSTSLYLTDVAGLPNTKAAFKLVSIQEDRAGVPADKIGVRFVHLGPDAGDLTCSLLKTDGSKQSIVPGLSFASATDYQYFDNNSADEGLVKFSIENSNTGARILTGVSFSPGWSYVIVITGFLKDQERKLSAGKNADGSPKYNMVTISRNLRVVVRKSY